MVPGTEGGVTIYQPGRRAHEHLRRAMKYQAEGVPLVIAGQEYGTGSSRDWAAKGTRLLGVKAVSRKASNVFIAATWSAWACLPCQFKEDTKCGFVEARRYETFDLLGNRSRHRAATGSDACDSSRERRHRRDAGHAWHRYADRG
jgi:aconitate hydratase